jgi:hypothetical protein
MQSEHRPFKTQRGQSVLSENPRERCREATLTPLKAACGPAPVDNRGATAAARQGLPDPDEDGCHLDRSRERVPICCGLRGMPPERPLFDDGN